MVRWARFCVVGVWGGGGVPVAQRADCGQHAGPGCQAIVDQNNGTVINFKCRTLTPVLPFATLQFLWVWNDLLVALVFAGGDTQPLTVAIREQLRSFSANIDVIAPAAFFRGSSVGGWYAPWPRVA